jgi:hypothetical protein
MGCCLLNGIDQAVDRLTAMVFEWSHSPLI